MILPEEIVGRTNSDPSCEKLLHDRSAAIALLAADELLRAGHRTGNRLDDLHPFAGRSVDEFRLIIRPWVSDLFDCAGIAGGASAVAA